ncbi:MAG: dihydroorotate dehydrogenase-like protein [Candidatus Nealsonbacteria bacterium]|nr:dihydroorotate dehydrogenase-like protein [Candidatus Nealsonbacteria bacterium]
MTVDLTTEYLGLTLKNPLVVAASPVTADVGTLQQAEAAGASAAVLPSLFEEQIVHEEVEFNAAFERGAESSPEAMSYFPEPQEYRLGRDVYLDHIREAKRAVSIPVIASLNGTSEGGWIRYATLMEEAGADAIELNIYFIAADVTQTGAQVERQYLDLISAVKESISIPLSAKVGPQFSSPGNMALRMVEAGADGLVLFNRFLQPDVDLDELAVTPRLTLSTSAEMLLPMRWIAILRGQTDASLALTSGVHSGGDLAKALLAGADVAMVASSLLQEGVGHIETILIWLRQWMEAKQYDSVEQLKGSVSQASCSNPKAFERGNYMKALTQPIGDPA